MNESDMYEATSLHSSRRTRPVGWTRRGRGLQLSGRGTGSSSPTLLVLLLEANDDDEVHHSPRHQHAGDTRFEIKLTSADGGIMKTVKNLEDGRMEIGDEKEFILRAGEWGGPSGGGAGHARGFWAR